MKFTLIADVFEQITTVSARLQITELLAGLFKKASPDQARIISYLSLGTLRPPYEGMQFNFAQKNVRNVIALLTNHSEKEVDQAAKKVGDLGSAVEALDNWKKPIAELTLEQVYDQLVHLEQISGTGSVDEKAAVLLNLLQQLDARCAKFVVRMILGTLRLGFSDMTLIDALSWMEVGNKTLRTKLEHAYNICADIGLIAKTLKKDGIDAIEHMHIKVGIPIRPAGAERLPSAHEIFDKLGPCSAQPKLDGFRLQIHVDNSDPKKPLIRFFSRNLIDMTAMFPDVKEAVEQLNVKQIICEGEAIVYDPMTGHFLPFQETVKRKRKHGIEEVMAELPLQVYLFDLLFLNGKSLLHDSHEERRKKLVEVLEKSTLSSPVLQVVEEKQIKSAKELQEYFEHARALGLEGVVVKKLQAPYQAGKRNFNWIKFKRLEESKLEDTIDCVILGYYAGAGKRVSFGMGAFLVGIYDKSCDCFKTIAKVGTGLTDQQWIDLKHKLDAIKLDHKPINVDCKKELQPDVYVDPILVCSVLADEITTSPLHTAGYALRFPRFIDYRGDKSAQQATSLHEIKRLYEDQFKK